MLLCGYYDEYLLENKNTFDQISAILASASIPEAERANIARMIVNDVFLPSIPKRKGKKPICLSLKPTSETERIIYDIQKQLAGDDYVSQYFCRMLMSYCRKPISERERIVFKDSYQRLETACAEGRSIVFSVIWDERRVHEVVPYALATGAEEMFNYLLCEEINPATGEPEARSYRVNRITRIGFGHRTTPISKEVRERCDRSISFAPQYAINSDDEICVRLNDVGEKLYNRIYYGRPRYERIEDKEDGHYYYFRCSPTQIFHYFRRYDNSTAEILSPQYARDRMIRFHQGVLQHYTQSERGSELE
jgi:hypothetical protein